MMRLSPAALAVGLLFAAAFPLFASQSSEKDSTRKDDAKASPEVKLSANEQRLVKAVNAYRKKYKLEPLVIDAKLMKVARDGAPYFSHCIHGKWCWDRAHEAGFTGWASDDLAMGHESPEDAVEGWSHSDGHAHQMRGDFNMNGQWRNYKFNRIGVGISGHKYMAVFGRYDGKPKGD